MPGLTRTSEIFGGADDDCVGLRVGLRGGQEHNEGREPDELVHNSSLLPRSELVWFHIE